MGHPLLRNVVALSLLLLPSLARAEDKPALPNQVLGATLRIGGGGLFGPGTDQATNPIWAIGASLDVRLGESIYLDLSGDSSAPTGSSAGTGAVLLQIDQEQAGIRAKLGPPAAHGLVGLGGGYARLHDRTGAAQGQGPLAYGLGGYETLVFGGGESAGYVGAELVYDQYFMPASATFRGSRVEGRVTFSYYFGGSEVSECR